MTNLASRPNDPNAPAPGELERVRQFINTVDIEAGTDVFGTTTSAKNWLVTHGLLNTTATITDQQLQHLYAIRGALRNLVLANNHGETDQSALALLNRAAQDATLTMAFSSQTDAQLKPTGEDVQAVISTLFAIIYDAMKEGTWLRLKACMNDECQWAFYDYSKNRSGKWCSMAICGSRMKVRAYRTRQTNSDSQSI